MNRWVVDTNRKKSKINKEIQGHFSEHLGRCIYGGLFVGMNSEIPNKNGIRSDVAEALRQIRVPVLRWPGGCFADEYHWKDGIGPLENRKRMINTHWGGVVEDNSFGTHEFLELCAQIGCEPYINGNVGSGTVQEMSEWVEYMTFDGVSPTAELRRRNGKEKPWNIKYFGVGNENWGCGGNMRPSYYADLYRQFQTYLRNYGKNRLYKIACGPSVDDYEWTKTVMEIAGNYMDGLSLHHYTVPGTWKNKGSATQFSEEEYFTSLEKALFMEELIQNHTEIMNRYDPEHRVGLIVDEWGAWYDVEPGTNPGFLYQQNTMRDAIIAALNLNIFNKHSDRVRMANIAQTVNVLQSVILTEGDKMVKTPTYYVFDLYKDHQDAQLVESWIDAGTLSKNLPKLHESGSIDGNGTLHLTLANLSPSESADICCELSGMKARNISSRILSGEMHDHNTFEQPSRIGVREFENITSTENGFCFTIPACSVMEITVKDSEIPLV